MCWVLNCWLVRQFWVLCLDFSVVFCLFGRLLAWVVVLIFNGLWLVFLFVIGLGLILLIICFRFN